ncbi:hypothetical protein B9Y60_10520 [Stenotrophomonas maltophilia]|nr:hypothetical protein B9Y73_10520 [Stenotrophomonas maltophilia]PJL55111.1 hypothetical protein B9Y60_10520 [Stenotrophomonas maltophilia]
MRVHWAGDDEARETMIRIAAELQSRVQTVRGVELEKPSNLKTLLGASWVIVEGQGKREKLVHLSPEMKYLWTYPTSLALAGSTLDWKISTTERGIDFPKEVWQEERAAIFSWMVEGAQLFFLGAAIDKN